jgi:hypothetical protein
LAVGFVVPDLSREPGGLSGAADRSPRTFDAGIVKMEPQFGHFPFFPASAAAVRTGLPHCEHANSILPAESRFGAAAEGDSPDGRPRGFGLFVAGISAIAPQLGHFPFFPAVWSGVRISRLQLGQ